MNTTYKQKFWGVALQCGILAAMTFACNIGMGDIVDLEAPTITITSPTSLSYVGKKFTMTGDCTDNVKVTSIEVQSIPETAAALSFKVSMEGEKWSAEVEIEEEGEYTFRVIASDRNRNTSVNSVKQITLLVDFDPPVFKNIEIDRGGGHTVPLLPAEELETLNAGEYADIDYFQNESFKIKADMAENMSIQQGATLELYDEEGNLFLSKLQTSTSLFAPEWEITASDINAAAAGKNITINPSEKRYFKVKITSRDDAGNPAHNEFWHLCWHPDADSPRIASSFENDGVIITAKESAIPVYVFDDDNLDKIYYKIYSESEWSALPGASDDDKFAPLASLFAAGTVVDSFTEHTANGRETTGMTVVSPPENGDFRIALLTKDKKPSGGTVWSQKAFRLTVTDDTAPIIMVDAPVENETPVLRADSASLFLDIKGYSIDKSGTALVLIAYVPQGKSVTDAENALKTTASNGGGGGYSDPSLIEGVKIWKAVLSSEEEQTIGGSLYKKNPFEIAINVNDIDNAPRRFVLYAENAAGGKTYKNFTILGNTQGPAVSIEYKDAVGVWREMSDVHTHDKFSDLELRIKVSSTAPINTLSLTEGSSSRTLTLQDTDKASSTGATAVDGRGIFENDYDGANRVYTFLATDSLGNETRAQKTVIISTLPVLERITSDMSDRTFAAGETITLQAVFSAPVRASGVPRIALFYNEFDPTPKYADYSKGGGSAALEFTFVVPENAQSDKLLTKGDNLILLENGSSIIPTDSGTPVRLPQLAADKLLQAEKTFKLDGVAPRITGIDAGSSAEWNKEGSVIEISATVDKYILVEGSPRLRLSTSEAPTAIEASFVRIAQAGANAVLVFNYKIDGAFTAAGTQAQDNYVTVSYGEILDAGVVKDLAGNPLSPQFAGGALKTSGGSLIKIDTTAPAAPSLKANGALAAGSYNDPTAFTVDGGETGATIQYTTTNGSTWTDYTGSFTVSTTSGEIFARQTDKAGNVSAFSNASKVTIANAGPFLAAITCDIPDGTYPQGQTLTFKLIFTGGAVHTAGGTAASITIGGGSAGDNKGVDVPVRSVAEGAAGNILSFDYTIPANVIMSPVNITAINLAGVQSADGLPAPTWNASDTSKFDRPGLNILAKAPTITGYMPVKEGILADGTIRLTFDTEVWPESGTITIEPNYGADTWVAPPVLSNEDFEKVFNALDATNKQYIMQTSTSIEPALDETTGRPLGPYLKTTHGLDMTGTSAVPDLNTKYVLKFDAKLTGTDPEAQNFRKAFKAAGYHKQVIDVTSSAVAGAGTKTIIITPPEALPVGRNWQLYMTAGAFRDAAGNLSGAIAGSSSTDTSNATYTFRSNKVATPVIRVNRVSTNSPTVKPASKATVRIDSETPGATITYGESAPLIVTANKDQTYTLVQTGNNPDITVTELRNVSPIKTYSSSSQISIGEDDDFYTARKDYVAAKATKAGVDSDVGYEGVFKSLIIYRLNPSSAQNQWNQNFKTHLRLEGATIYGSSSHIAGFPLRVNDMTGKYVLFAYTGTSQVLNYKDFIWISYEIVSKWYQNGVSVSTTNTPIGSDVTWETKTHFTRTYGTYGLNTALEQTQ